MNILLTGASGQLGVEIAKSARSEGLSIAAFGRSDLDITRPERIAAVLEEIRPDWLINAAAFTRVDEAESRPEDAFSVNRDGPANLARACAARGVAMLHFSTDFVFDGSEDGSGDGSGDGRKRRPYTEAAPISPLSVYGRSKAEGEARLRAVLERHVIVRTSWLYGAHGDNFVKTMIRLARERERLDVVADQYGCPTFAGDLAEAALRIVRVIHERSEGRAEIVENAEPWGTYHYCGAGVTTWHGLAEAAIGMAKQFETMKVATIKAISTADYPTPATRPAYSALDCTRIRERFGISPKPWREQLEKVLTDLLAAM